MTGAQASRKGTKGGLQSPPFLFRRALAAAKGLVSLTIFSEFLALRLAIVAGHTEPCFLRAREPR